MDKDTLLKPRLPEREVEIEGLGTVRVRGLSRADAMVLNKLTADTGAMERKCLHLGLVDPSLSEAEVQAWYEVAPVGELDAILTAIHDLSGLGEGSAKAAYKSNGRES